MRTLLIIVVLLTSGCTTLNMIGGSTAFCRAVYVDMGADLDAEVSRELRHEFPPGALARTNLEAEWNSYWNHRIYHVWDIGPASCDGTYKGPLGSDMIRHTLQMRHASGLPEVIVEERNLGKVLHI